MLESLAALRESAQPSPVPASQSSTHDESLNDLPPIYGSISSTDTELASSQESVASSPLPVLLTYHSPATSRFSTVVGNRSQERILIDLESESENEGEDRDDDGGAASDNTQNDSADGPSDTAVLAEVFLDTNREMDLCAHNVTRETEALLPEMDDLERRAAVVDVIGITDEGNSGESAGSPTANSLPAGPDHDADLEPPFVTDGRGRVVWSSTRSSGRGVRVPAHQGQVHMETPPRESPGQGQVLGQVASRMPAGTATPSERRMKARRPVIAREPSSDTTAIITESTGFTTDGRGRVVWMAGSPSPVLHITTQRVGIDSVDGDSESRAEAEIEGEPRVENTAASERSDDDSPRRSFFGRMYDAMFS